MDENRKKKILVQFVAATKEDAELVWAFRNACKDRGRTKTSVLRAMLRSYIDRPKYYQIKKNQESFSDLTKEEITAGNNSESQIEQILDDNFINPLIEDDAK